MWHFHGYICKSPLIITLPLFWNIHILIMISLFKQCYFRSIFPSIVTNDVMTWTFVCCSNWTLCVNLAIKQKHSNLADRTERLSGPRSTLLSKYLVLDELVMHKNRDYNVLRMWTQFFALMILNMFWCQNIWSLISWSHTKSGVMICSMWF